MVSKWLGRMKWNQRKQVIYRYAEAKMGPAERIKLLNFVRLRI